MSDRTLLDAFLAFTSAVVGTGKTASAIAAELGQRGMPGGPSTTPLSEAARTILGDVRGEHVDATEAGIRRNLDKYVGAPGTTLTLSKSGDVYSVA